MRTPFEVRLCDVLYLLSRLTLPSMSIPMPSVPLERVHEPPSVDINDATSSESEDDECSDEDDDNVFNGIDLDAPIYTADGLVDTDKTVGTVLVTVLDWMTKHKATLSPTSDVWTTLRALLPGELNLPTFSVFKTLLDRHMQSTVTRIDVCVNDCVAYYDCENQELKDMGYVRLEDPTQCPVCGEQRFLLDSSNQQIRRKFFYYLPCGLYFKDLFTQADLVPFLHTNTPCPLPSSVRNSRGWKHKVTDNPNINRDSRNQPVILSADGVPYFKDKNARSGWPFILKVATLPDSLANNTSMCHLIAFMASFYYDTDPDTNLVVRIKRDPLSLQPILVRITDELLTLQKKGVLVQDASLSEDDENYSFYLKVILLFVVADYPGLGKLSGFSHQGRYACHWCKHPFLYLFKGHNCAVHNRRQLPSDHPFRTNVSFGQHEQRDPPPIRTHARSVRESNMCEEYSGPKSKHPSKYHGIKEWCPLVLLAMFCLIWDMLPDLMHICKGLIQSHLIPLLKGTVSYVAPIFARGKYNKARTEEAKLAIVAAHDLEKDYHKKCCLRAAKLVLSNSNMDLVDTRCKQFGIIPNWVRASMKVFQQTGVCSYNYRSINIASSDYSMLLMFVCRV